MATYEEKDYRTYRVTDEGEREQLCNFTARITKETRSLTGMSTTTTLTLTGLAHNPERPKIPIVLPPVEVDAEHFAGLGWVLREWGVRAIIQPGNGIKEDLRTAIQTLSKPEVLTIYRHIGWTEIAGKRAYLHTKGAITAKGNDPTINVRLPLELNKYDLDATGDLEDAWEHTLALTTLAPAEIAWPLWCAVWAPVQDEVDFAIHLTGRSGTFKSELVSLFQSFYGRDMDARHLPASWSSTGNALEAQAFFAANAIMVIDDFVPVGSSWQIRSYQTNADKIIRAQGNQSGRARLTDTSGLQQTYYPRGLIISTGEDTPEGHSVRARMMILEITPGDVQAGSLTRAQKARPKYSTVMAAYIKDLCTRPVHLKVQVERIRNANLNIGHTRTPPMMARLIATGTEVLHWAMTRKLISEDDADDQATRMTAAITQAAKQQAKYLETTDPVEIFFAGLRQCLGATLAHIRSMNGGIPSKATLMGWTEEHAAGDMPTYKSHGPCIGWIDWHTDELYLEINIGYTAVKKVCGAELTLTKQTLLKRIKDAGLLVRTDDARQRNTIRITAEHHVRQVLAMAASTTLDCAERPNDDDTEAE